MHTEELQFQQKCFQAYIYIYVYICHLSLKFYLSHSAR